MSRYIDADAMMAECEEELKDKSLWHDEDTTKDYAEGSDDGKRIIMNIIDSAPSIEIVRCKECRHYDGDDYGEPTRYCVWHGSPIMPDDFCSYGEREGEVIESKGCVTCKHTDKEWYEKPCEDCHGNSGYERKERSNE